MKGWHTNNRDCKSPGTDREFAMNTKDEKNTLAKYREEHDESAREALIFKYYLWCVILQVGLRFIYHPLLILTIWWDGELSDYRRYGKI